jgi:hypothetical protein
MKGITMTKENLDHILTALIHLEHYMQLEPEQYWATVALAREAEAPQFVVEYFSRKALEVTADKEVV